jgi:hypothetical protein
LIEAFESPCRGHLEDVVHHLYNTTYVTQSDDDHNIIMKNNETISIGDHAVTVNFLDLSNLIFKISVTQILSFTPLISITQFNYRMI